MDEIKISIDSDSIRLWIEELYDFPNRTSEFGGYDVRGGVEIRCGCYRAHGALEFSTGEIWQFYRELLPAYNDLTGKAAFLSSEGNLEFAVKFGSRGHIMIEGVYKELHTEATRLMFEMNGDQSYLQAPLAQLAQLIAKYGDNRGLHAERNEEAMSHPSETTSQPSRWPPYR